jgi:hypothetical protein
LVPAVAVAVDIFKRSVVLQFLTSLKLTAYLLFFIALASAIATFIESRHGALGAQAMVYNTRWFELALALLGLNLLLILIKRYPYNRRHTGFLCVHVAIIVILLGAAMTRFLGYEGTMPIREGDSTNFIYSNLDHVRISVDEHETSFAVRLFRAGPQSISRRVEVAGQNYRVSVRDYWPHWAETYVPAEGGVPAVRLATVGSAGMESRFLLAGQSLRLGQSIVRFSEGELGEEESLAPRGDFRVRLAGETHRLAVPERLPASLTADGYVFTIVEFQPDYKVGQAPDQNRPMINPMIRVEITGPTGQQGERMLFAFHPDFEMSHSGPADSFLDLPMVYSYQTDITLARDGSDGLLCRASMSLAQMDMGSAEVDREIKAGDVFAVEELVLYQDDTNSVSFVVQEFIPSVVLQPGPSRDPNMPAAARITVTDSDGATAEAVVVRNSPTGSRLTIGDREAKLRLGPVRIPLPYRLQLEDFVLLTYPGSENPASYESHVLLFDPDRGIDGQPVRIYMNHPLTHRGFKHFQSSYDTDELGTILSVNHDPGKWPTYLGYSLLVFGFIFILAKDLIWPRREHAAEILP